MQKLIILILFGLCLQFSIAGSPAFAGRSDAVKINTALKALQEDKPAKALEILTHMLEQPKPEITALLIAGNAYMQLGENEKALALYQKGVTIFPNDIGLLQNKAIALYYLQRFSPAGDAFALLSKFQLAKAKEIKEEVEAKTGQAPAWYKSQYQAAVCYYKSEHYNKALTAVMPLLSYGKTSQSVDAKKLLAHIYIALEQWKKASVQLDILVATHSKDRSLWLLLANVNIRQNRLTKASSALQVAHCMQPPTRSECVRLAKLYLQVNAPLLASKILLASPQKLTASQHDLMAIAYERAGYVEKAVLSLQEAIALEDTSKRHLEFGKLLYRNQLYEKAIEPLNVAYTKAKKKGLPLYLLGQCFLNMNNYNKATTLFVKAKKYQSVRSNAKNALSLIKHIQRMQQESVTG